MENEQQGESLKEKKVVAPLRYGKGEGRGVVKETWLVVTG